MQTKNTVMGICVQNMFCFGTKAKPKIKIWKLATLNWMNTTTNCWVKFNMTWINIVFELCKGRLNEMIADNDLNLSSYKKRRKVFNFLIGLKFIHNKIFKYLE